MTVIAYRDGVLAADSGVYTSGSALFAGTRTKVVKCPDGALCGATGISGDCADFTAWCAAGRFGSFAKLDDGFLGVLIQPDGEVRFYNDRAQWYGVEAPFVAIGIGDAVATGAMHMGATAIQAVEAAITWSVWCGGPVQSVRLESAP